MPDLVSPEACNSLGFQGGDRVQLLVNKMMLDNYVNVVGEGYGIFILTFYCLRFHFIHAFILSTQILKRGIVT